jgi:phenylalanyl-tRNA synthetase beta subunit
VGSQLTYQQVYSLVLETLDQARPKDTLVELSPLDIYQSEPDQSDQHITLRLSIVSHDRTLTDSEVNKLLDEVALVAKDKLGAERL